MRRRKGKQSIIYIGCLPIRTNWKNRKRNVRFNKSFMQSFDLLMEKIKDLAERLKDIFDIAESDICESCEAKRTKHGSSCIAEIEATGKASIKWCEKYRPP